MRSDTPPVFFGKEQAEHYDKRWEKLGAINNGLYLLSKIILNNLPADANVLCVGVGTGRELFYLAEQFPGWHFMALDASGPMLDVCRSKAEKLGFLSRCEFHEGYVYELPSNTHYDAATSILVSQFLLNPSARQQFFKEILQRLKANAYLINADLATPIDSQQYDVLLGSWIKMQMFAGLTEEEAVTSTSRWNEDVAVSSPDEIESLLAAAGFASPTLIYQALFIHTWLAKKTVE